jgi:hypothetical protein
MRNRAHFEIANADSRSFESARLQKEMDMTTNQPTTLGRVPEDNKRVGRGHGDHPAHPFGERFFAKA